MSLARPSAAQQPADTLPPTARAIALLLASTPTVQDAQPGVLHQLLEFAHRYTAQVLSDGQLYAEHAGRSGASKIEMDDIVLAIQARVGWEFGGRVPKEYILSLASQTNATPLPSVPEVFGVRLPPSSETLTAVNFNLVPNKPPPEAKLYDEEVEEIEEEDEDEDDEDLPDGQDDDEDADMEPAAIPYTNAAPITPTDVDISAGTPLPVVAAEALEENSDAEEADGLFGGEGDDDDDNSGDDAMEEVQTTGDTQTNGVKRKLVEEDDYD
ncbi:transcription initiation factor IID, 31kD subunit-domain-containing protein [Suillus fuscotomentosus]|uniref:Transcription initiation factor IID, 31kD subunit-domain-containing protein n=1 Tax=Suillus fuscotomentosus TaxID=1912939 RepID=A0AAD4EJT8_9AGAM|nr:transcription initiation factor IID, 31kD subunit-domain-containing protein [Suillus fuscotomentosus]KAG1907366.1 transcription initiation factor IID, 31kD subunit-domain-containing protein [Suillus fuscotomentosus]